jgi:hypothetical protein
MKCTDIHLKMCVLNKHISSSECVVQMNVQTHIRSHNHILHPLGNDGSLFAAYFSASQLIFRYISADFSLLVLHPHRNVFGTSSPSISAVSR